MYRDYFGRFLKDPLEGGHDKHRALFSAMVAEREPLDLEIVQELLAASR